MKTYAINSTNFAKSLGSNANIAFDVDKEQWLNTITAGQILKGKVLKVYSEHKYGVMLGGQERIVDSAIPLSIGNTISGKVTSINEKVVTMKIVETHVLNNAESRVKEKISPGNSVADFKVIDYGVNLTDLQQKIIVDAANKSQTPDIAIKAGLYLAKLGLPVTADLLHELTLRINSKGDLNLIYLNNQVPKISFQTDEVVRATGLSEVVENLRRYFQGESLLGNKFIDVQKKIDLVENNNYVDENKFISDESSNDSEELLLEGLLSNILNINTQSSLQHSLKSFPLLIDDRLVEFEVAFFDTLNENAQNNALKSRSVRFSLDTKLGKVFLYAHIVNDRLNINFSTVDALFLDALINHKQDLVDQLKGVGWLVDAINFSSDLNQDSAAFSIVKHVLHQGSINIAA